MTFEQILTELRKKNYRPVYLLHGDEPYFIDEVTRFVEEKVLTDAEKAFNQSIFYGKDADHKAILDAARRYPMGADRQVVILKEAQDMKGIEALITYVENPLETTLFLVSYKHKRLAMNTKLGKAFKKHALVFESKSLYDNQIPRWIEARLKRSKLTIQPAAAELIAEYLGTDLGKVANELEKLSLNLPAGATVSESDIETHIGISKDYNVFELQRALAFRDIKRANRIVAYFSANERKHPLPMILATLYSFFSKVYVFHFVARAGEKEQLSALKLRSPYFLKEYKQAARTYPRARLEAVMEILLEYDLKSKGLGFNATGKPDGALLQEMIFRLMH